MGFMLVQIYIQEEEEEVFLASCEQNKVDKRIMLLAINNGVYNEI